MDGFKSKQVIKHVRFVNYMIPLAILLVVILLTMIEVIKLETSVFITVAIALVGWPLAVDSIFLQINNALKRKLETETIREIDDALKEINSSFVSTVTFSNDFVVQPITIPANHWYKAASTKWQQISDDLAKMRDASLNFHTTIEANEIVIIHLEQYYQYLLITIGNFIQHVDDLNSSFMLATSDWHLKESTYKKEVAKFKVLQEEWVTLAAYSIDLRKMLQNELLGDIFKRKLNARKPMSGYGTTLDKVATRDKVQLMIDEEKKQIGI